MFYPTIYEHENSRDMIDMFYGYNHTEAARDGEFYDMRNMSSDNFPLLSPRDIRRVLLSLSSTDWAEQEIEVTGQYYGDAGGSYAIYTISDFPVDGVQKECVLFDVDQIIESVRVVVTYKDAKGKKLRADEYDGPTEFYSKGDVAAASIQVFAYPAEGVPLDPEQIDTYVTDFAVYVYNAHLRGMLIKNQQLAYMIGTGLYYGGTRYDMAEFMPAEDDHLSLQQMISYGAYILIFPLGLYFNTVDPADRGYLGSAFSKQNVTVTFVPVDLYGEDISSKITYSSTDPGAAVVGEGNYWVDARQDDVFMYQSTGTAWTPVATCWMRITVPGNDVDLREVFMEGDAVFMNTTQEDVNNGSVIQKLEKNAITVIAFPKNSGSSKTYTTEPFFIERRIPELDYVCVYNNRVWGCYYGYKDGEFLNEIYACKQGDPKNWYDYTTLLGSYAASVGADGPWTGAVTYQGYPTFFKENAIYRVFGSVPSNFQIDTLDARGVQRGSDRSIAICGEYLVYKSMADICIFDGSSPVSVSAALGSEVYTHAVGGAALNKYYVSMYDSTGTPQLLVYDISRGIWTKEDELRIQEFVYSNSGQLYGQNGLQVFGFGIATDDLSLESEPAEEYVTWYAETGHMGFAWPDHKYVSKLTVRAFIPYKSEIRVLLSCDDEPWWEVCVLRGHDKIESQSIDMPSMRCDHYRLRFEGHGEVRIYGITRTLEVGDDA